jgi:hypothetical protein
MPPADSMCATSRRSSHCVLKARMPRLAAYFFFNVCM